MTFFDDIITELDEIRPCYGKRWCVFALEATARQERKQAAASQRDYRQTGRLCYEGTVVVKAMSGHLIKH